MKKKVKVNLNNHSGSTGGIGYDKEQIKIDIQYEDGTFQKTLDLASAIKLHTSISVVVDAEDGPATAARFMWIENIAGHKVGRSATFIRDSKNVHSSWNGISIEWTSGAIDDFTYEGQSGGIGNVA
jgi:hypothetical protein